MAFVHSHPRAFADFLCLGADGEKIVNRLRREFSRLYVLALAFLAELAHVSQELSLSSINNELFQGGESRPKRHGRCIIGIVYDDRPGNTVEYLHAPRGKRERAGTRR